MTTAAWVALAAVEYMAVGGFIGSCYLGNTPIATMFMATMIYAVVKRQGVSR